VKIERTITVFDNESEELIDEINIDHISLVELTKMFNPSTDDPLMYNVYEIKSDIVPLISSLLKNKISFDLKRNTYYVECSQLPPYDFGNKHKVTDPDKTVRIIKCYDKKTDSVISEQRIDIKFEILSEIFTPYAKDPRMFTPYIITPKEAKGLIRYIDFVFDFDRYTYQLECFRLPSHEK
jgi:hypothetical protein